MLLKVQRFPVVELFDMVLLIVDNQWVRDAAAADDDGGHSFTYLEQKPTFKGKVIN
jgi:hypothetical protein